ncbi:MAG TPA: DMT family transporter [Terriglobales bacterium]|nr:DMT family transporter [Terriglobales bacterium]
MKYKTLPACYRKRFCNREHRRALPAFSILKRIKTNHPAAPHLALIAVQVLFGTWPIFGKIALLAVPSMALVSIRVAGASLAFIAIGRVRGGIARIARRDWPLLIVSSCLGVVFNQWLFVKALSLTSVINATLLSTTIPVFTLLVGIILGTDRAALRRIIGIGLAAAGVVYLIGPSRAAFSSLTRAGDVLLVANSLCYGAYIAISQPLVQRYNALTVITWIFIVACVATVPVGIISLSEIDLGSITLGVWLAMIYIILLPTVGAYYLNAWALARVVPSTVAVYIYLQPLIAFAVAPLILEEAVTLRAIIASVLIFAGVLVVTRGRRNLVVEEVSEHPEAFGH